MLKVVAGHHDLFSALQSGFQSLEFSSRARWEYLFHMNCHMCAMVIYAPIVIWNTVRCIKFQSQKRQHWLWGTHVSYIIYYDIYYWHSLVANFVLRCAFPAARDLGEHSLKFVFKRFGVLIHFFQVKRYKTASLKCLVFYPV